MASTDEIHAPAGDLRALFDEHPLPILSPDTVKLISFSESAELEQTSTAIDAFNAALAANDVDALQACFFAEQAYWKDTLALTWHLRTFREHLRIAKSLIETKQARRCDSEWIIEGAVFVPATPTIQFLDVSLCFRTSSPAAACSARALLLPTRNTTSGLDWKIWILSTDLTHLDIQPEHQDLLRFPGRRLGRTEDIETDVLIIGAGNSGAALAARLKALGVNSVMVERHADVGDNWALRYDCMKFHIPTPACDMPYMGYQDRFRGEHLLSKDELADHLRKYVDAFHLNVITSVKIVSTVYDKSTKRWIVKMNTPAAKFTVTAKHLVQATGIGSQKPYVPAVPDKHLFRGLSIHSSEYKNGQTLVDQGVKSVLIMGSANTAFDILGDCQAAGIQATMNVRSPTYIVPVEYIRNKWNLGTYDFGVEVADRMFLTLPAVEPDRYETLRKAGFPALDSADPSQALWSNLIERAGGHYIDIGGTEILTQGKAGIKAGVEPTAFTETGLLFSDGSTAAADAVIWCTGFADRDVRDTTVDILGGDQALDSDNLLGPREIADRLGATWGVDSEGEIRGMWKRHLHVENYWVMGGFTVQHRWYSRVLALQIKAALENILPPAYLRSE
ncbi:uncharacterized protein FIESC28_01996 [Fusarium coffeatum]|uniref:FAD/NAD(P)-binding domain-containing protein n=1 Tax=Fusarium coffeatum TaxID=231269 RepID=A0A366S7F6_9HYPO|nr:uncharacterized protein FIESC28_01996 [Fusarium coffeatum]RBR25261.1 hypothetical protein FIESC28_01996 [Fusarium coffeatum]